MNVGNEDGREMCKKIKDDAEHKHIPVIFISSDHEALKQYRQHGADSFVKKPFQFSTLLDIVKREGNLN